MAPKKKRAAKSKSGTKPSRRKPARKTRKQRTAAKPKHKARRSPALASMSVAPRKFRAVCRDGDFKGTITTNPDIAQKEARDHMLENETHSCEVIVKQ